tara:strand:- start:45 stop:461 length:417 start_codon:yes stop_codon:yes gene_type:complete
MKITKSQLKQIIKEELQSVLKEQRKKPGWEYDAKLTGQFVNNNTAFYLNKARAAKTTEEALKHIFTALGNLNNKHAGVFPRIQAVFNRAQNTLDNLDDRIYELEQERLANFKKVFKKAKDEKKGRFTFGGKEYTTDLK